MIETTFSDIDLSFGVNIKGDIAKKINENSISQSIKNIVMIKNKLFKPKWGAGIESKLFELMDPIALNLLEQDIYLAIKKNDPRISKIKVKLDSSYIDQNALKIVVYYQIKDSKEFFPVSVVIEVLKK